MKKKQLKRLLIYFTCKNKTVLKDLKIVLCGLVKFNEWLRIIATNSINLKLQKSTKPESISLNKEDTQNEIITSLGSGPKKPRLILLFFIIITLKKTKIP